MRLGSVFSIAFSVATVGFAGAAMADGTPGSLKDAPLGAPIHYEWSGLSVGAGIGAGSLDTQVKAKAWRKEVVKTEKCHWPPPKEESAVGENPPKECFDLGATKKLNFLKAQDDDDSWNIFGTFQIGYDRVFRDRLLIGAFADIDFYKDADLSISGYSRSGTLSGRIERDNIWTIGGRIGFLATERILIYGLAGYSQLHLDGELTAQFANQKSSLEMDIDKWVDGYTLGAGFEAKLDKRLSLKLEYRYSAFDGASMKTSSTSTDSWKTFDPGVEFEHVRTIKEGGKVSIGDTDVHSVRAVLSFKLGSIHEPLAPLK